jgi:hypothetical protein
MYRNEMCITNFVGKPNVKNIDVFGVNGRIIFATDKVWNGLIWLRIGSSGGICERGIGPSGSIKGGYFLKAERPRASQERFSP